MLIDSCWLLAAGCWLLAGCWLAAGCWLTAVVWLTAVDCLLLLADNFYQLIYTLNYGH